MKTKLVISRKWHNPDIQTFVNHEEVGASIALDDFLTAMVEEIGNPALLMTKSGLKVKLEVASAAVLHELRQSTVHIV